VAEAQDPVADGIHRSLIRYGLNGRVGRFGSVHRIECDRGDRVVIHTDRGIETGEVLVPPHALQAGDPQPPTGELLRRLTAEDERVLAALQLRETAIVERGRKAIAERNLAVEIVASESLLDARTTILYFVGQSSEELGRLSVQLASDPRERVRFEPLLLPEAASGDDERVASDDAFEREADMKGPYERLKYDFRRVWECPVCKRREKTDGGVTFRLCPCATRGEGARGEKAEPVPMKMIEDGPRPRFPTRPRWPRLPEEIEAAAARTPSSAPSVVHVPISPAVTPPADPPGPENETPPAP
jgi:hypothetical protein